MLAGDDFGIQSSWATEPYFYAAPHPEQWTPFPYQEAAVEYALARDHVLFGDAPGLGKTAECILLGNEIGAKHTLVICPASLRLNWEREIWRWSNLPNVSTYPIFKASDGVSHSHNYVITSYSLMCQPAIHRALMSRTWDHLILDEAHALKDPKKNKRVHAICDSTGLCSVAGRITLASGTILPNQPVECLGPNTLVLTSCGWKRIIHVTRDDLVWDGAEWVKHDGLIFQGYRRTIGLAGIDLTPDHQLLSNGVWRSAATLARDENTQFRALETGLENLPLEALKQAQKAGSWRSLFNALAELRHIPQLRAIYGGERMAAALAGRGKVFRPAGGAIQARALTSSIAAACLAASRISCRGAITQKPRAIGLMADAGSEWLYLGCGTEVPSYATWFYSTVGMMRRLRSTGSTTLVATSRGTSDLQRGKVNRQTSALCGSSSNGSTSLKPVYDLVNAGPRRRFTVLSERGPLISHNCYNAIRMLNWDAIDRASLQDFRETYYALGEGWVFGPVVKYDQRGHPYTVRERHWSDQVRNVPRNLDDLQYRLRKNIMVRRRKDQVLHQLPPKQWHVFPMAITPEMRAAMKHPGWLEAQALYELDPDSFDRNVPIDGAISTAMRLLGEAMAPSVADYVDELFEDGVRKLVVGAFHRSVLTYLHERLKRYGVVYMDGSTNDRKKQWAVDEFQSKDEIGIMLGQMLPLGEGWTLTQAQDVLFAESYWVPGKMDQLLDRIHRIGQEGLYVCGHVPVVPGSIMERQLGTLVEKERNIHAALDG